MKSSPRPAAVLAAFDARTCSAPAVRLVEQCGLPDPVREKVNLTGAGNSAGQWRMRR
ncbi:predicted protein [Streptomyces viridosporus ATCC 14672]|uniref:Predicted protein n=1 Tax=Streptomyces viridosporus (strain ATCC 14672 / DSM 40746 / JCM 4963 / KCTC 9882 / NRRL B-12104 / FH 1290) TaxID=566461 RepID=D6A0K3_STRV1|nr:hypothetical protein [Streptomyces viridosporus]EFE67424.1 predicted protein [Streptomyces viridosporus ATCC 14672]